MYIAYGIYFAYLLMERKTAELGKKLVAFATLMRSYFPKKDFCFMSAHRQQKNQLLELFKMFLLPIGLPISNLRGQTYDGAANIVWCLQQMPGKNSRDSAISYVLILLNSL